MKARFLSSVAVLAGGVCLMCLPGSATIVPAGTPQVPGLPPDALALPPGSILLQSTPVEAFNNGFISGNFESQVYRDGVTGNLDFLYQFTSAGPDPIERLTAASFAGFITDVGVNATYNMPGFTGTVSPTSVDRPNASGDTIGFVINATPGSTSDVLQIDTNAQFFKAGFASVIDGQSINLTAFEPTTVPEPASVVFFSTTLLGTGLLLRRKLQTKRV